VLPVQLQERGEAVAQADRERVE